MAEFDVQLDSVIEALKTVYDPEIPVNVYDLGLIYDIEIVDKTKVRIVMTLTSPNCPAAGEIPQDVDNSIMEMVEGVESVNVELTFDPPYTTDMMSEEAKLELGFL